MRDALNSAIDEEMERDERVFILGEEVRKLMIGRNLLKWKPNFNKKTDQITIADLL